MYVISKDNNVKANLRYKRQYIYKENRSCNGLTDGRSPSVGPVVLTGHKGVLSAKCPLANRPLANCPVRNI
jgi:hypothetical protein